MLKTTTEFTLDVRSFDDILLAILDSIKPGTAATIADIAREFIACNGGEENNLYRRVERRRRDLRWLTVHGLAPCYIGGSMAIGRPAKEVQ